MALNIGGISGGGVFGGGGGGGIRSGPFSGLLTRQGGDPFPGFTRAVEKQNIAKARTLNRLASGQSVVSTFNKLLQSPLGQGISEGLKQSDFLFNKAINVLGNINFTPQATGVASFEEAFNFAQGQLGRDQDLLTNLQDRYKDIIPLTIEQAIRGVLEETPRFREEQQRAEAGVAEQFAGQREQLTRELQRFGLNPSSGQFVSSQRAAGLQEAASRAGASEVARANERTRAEQAALSNFQARAELATIGQGAIAQQAAGARDTALAAAGFKGKVGELQSDVLKTQANIGRTLGELGVAQSQAAGQAIQGLSNLASEEIKSRPSPTELFNMAQQMGLLF